MALTGACASGISSAAKAREVRASRRPNVPTMSAVWAVTDVGPSLGMISGESALTSCSCSSWSMPQRLDASFTMPSATSQMVPMSMKSAASATAGLIAWKMAKNTGKRLASATLPLPGTSPCQVSISRTAAASSDGLALAKVPSTALRICASSFFFSGLVMSSLRSLSIASAGLNPFCWITFTTPSSCVAFVAGPACCNAALTACASALPGLAAS
mmetsp:Transcript_86424/g.201035  ORF Transcript_86424/g.201035 Transcript_86424/m.201035 type:complete len:215 (-) Transcript_86424:913-1557(-)